MYIKFKLIICIPHIPKYSKIAFFSSLGVQIVSFDDWEKIDCEEIRRGKVLGKPREKITDIQEMLSIAEGGDRLSVKG